MADAVSSEKRNEGSELQSHGSSPSDDVASEAPVDPIAEIDAIKDKMREALMRVSRLAAVLRRQQKTARLVKSTLLSLKQLGDASQRF